MPPTHPTQADVAAAYRTLIAHETEPKEQDFYRTRLQRLELRTEPESDDFVTQLAVKQIEGEAAWWRSIDFDRNASRTFESMTGDSQQAVRTGVERVLAYLQSTSRLVPAGGMALTAEQVEDVRTAREELRGYRNFTGYGRSHVNQLIAAVDALFPATEPAEEAKPCGSNSITLGWCKLTARHEGLHTNGTYLWGTPSEPDPPAPSEPAEERCQSVSIFRERCALVPGHDGRHAANGCAWGYPPAPAEPAEEETKAEVWDAGFEAGYDHAGCEHTPSGISIDPPLNPYDERTAPTSSPVVPAPTETGPWQRIEDVPEGVLQIKDRHGRTWLVVGGTWRFEWHDGNWYEPHTNVNAQAPFVAAAEEG